jgi:hypothetical protein
MFLTTILLLLSDGARFPVFKLPKGWFPSV